MGTCGAVGYQPVVVGVVMRGRMIRPLVVFGCIMNISDVIALAIIDKYGQFSDYITCEHIDNQSPFSAAFNFTIYKLNIEVDVISVAICDDVVFIGYVQYDDSRHKSEYFKLKNPLLSAQMLRMYWRQQQDMSLGAIAARKYYANDLHYNNRHVYSINLFDHNLLNKILDVIADILKKISCGLN